MRSFGFGVAMASLIYLSAAASFILIEQQAPAQSRANEHTNANVDQRKPDERIADYTLWLERFTGLLAFVGAAQLWFLIRADRTARISADAANVSAKAATRTFEREEALIRAQLHAAMRPAFSFLNTVPLDQRPANFGPGDFRIQSQNRGAAPGTLRAIRIWLSDALPQTFPVDGFEERITANLLERGEARNFDFVKPAKTDQYLFGYVRWHDMDGQRWRYRFCMRVRPAIQHGDVFCEWGGPAWNGEDADPDGYQPN